MIGVVAARCARIKAVMDVAHAATGLVGVHPSNEVKEHAMSLMNRFTPQAKQVLMDAHQEARRLHHAYIGTEHLLLGLTHDHASGIAGTVLHDLDVTPEHARHAIAFIVGYGTGARRAAPPELTASAKQALAYTLDEARALNHYYIGTEHLLLGLVRTGNGVAVGVLEVLGVTPDQVRSAVLRAVR